jgi:hypothetical protein
MLTPPTTPDRPPITGGLDRDIPTGEGRDRLTAREMLTPPTTPDRPPITGGLDRDIPTGEGRDTLREQIAAALFDGLSGNQPAELEALAEWLTTARVLPVVDAHTADMQARIGKVLALCDDDYRDVFIGADVVPMVRVEAIRAAIAGPSEGTTPTGTGEAT